MRSKSTVVYRACSYNPHSQHLLDVFSHFHRVSLSQGQNPENVDATIWTIKALTDHYLAENFELFVDVKAKIVLVDVGTIFGNTCGQKYNGKLCQKFISSPNRQFECVKCGYVPYKYVIPHFLLLIVLEDEIGTIPVLLFDMAQHLLKLEPLLVKEMVETVSGFDMVRHAIAKVMEKEMWFKLRIMNQNFHPGYDSELDLHTYGIVCGIKECESVMMCNHLFYYFLVLYPQIICYCLFVDLMELTD